MFDTVYNPYAHSYLCWGKNEALRRYRARLLNEALNMRRQYPSRIMSSSIYDPCLARSAQEKITSAELFQSPCTANEKQIFIVNTKQTSFTYVGTGNANQCRQRLLNLFNAKRNDKTVNCSFQQEYCTFDRTFQPMLPEKIHFIGLSGYYYVFNNLAHGIKKNEIYYEITK